MKNRTLAMSLAVRRISSGVIDITLAPATNAATHTSTKPSRASPGAFSATGARLKAQRVSTALNVAIMIASTNVNWAPASGTGTTPNGSVATTAINSQTPVAGRHQISPIIARPTSAPSGTSGDVAAARSPTASAAAPATTSVVRSARSNDGARIIAASIGVARTPRCDAQIG